MTRIVLVCEGSSDPPLVRDLADRVLRDTVAWLREQDGLDDHRSYGGLDESHEYLKWSKAPELFRQAGLRSNRGFGRSSPDPDYVATRKILLLIAYHQQQSMKDGGGVDGVLIFRDADHQAERHRGIEAAREEFVKSHEAPDSLHPWRQHIAIAVAKPTNEAWVVAGFEPTSSSEQAALAAARQELGFAPDEFPEKLIGQSVAKRVLGQLCPDPERRRRCWSDTPLETLRQRGERCGLPQFLDEVRDRLAPLFAPPREPT